MNQNELNESDTRAVRALLGKSLGRTTRLPLLDKGVSLNGSRSSTLNPYMGIDFAIRFGFAENNSKKIAGGDTRTSHPAIAKLRKVRHDNFAPCDSLMSHLATSRYRTLPLSSV
ncbi:MAG: hypothetical protein IKO55_00810, partial [Kiritimatiellae bacterium]|nr:hypothetical protein [Kiritimatiellia bacterium]